MENKIQTTLEKVRNALDGALQRAMPREDSWVALTSFVNDNGEANVEARDKIVMFVANIQRETTEFHNHHADTAPPPLYVDLSVMLVANFGPDNYAEGLGAISRTISYFQQHPVFDQANLPGLDPAVGRLTFELSNMTIPEVNDLITLAGIRYHPLVLYKVRMIPFDGREAEG
jgi:hypothetical protein